MNTCAPTSIGYLLPLTVPGTSSRDGISLSALLLAPDDQAEVDEALALTDLGINCFNCGRPASYEQVGQFWCSPDCCSEVMDALTPEPDDRYAGVCK